MATVAELFARLGVDTTPLQGVHRKVKRRLGPLQRTFEQAGRTMTRALTLPLTAAGGAAAKLSADFNAEFAKIEGLVGVPRRELQGMREDVLALGPATGKGPRELAEGLFFVTSAGLRGKAALDVLRQSARGSAAGLGEVKTVADAVTSVVNAYGPAVHSAAEATDILTATVREGKAEADQIAGSLGRVIPTAAELGVEFNEVGAGIAALTRVGAPVRQAVTSIASVLNTTLKPSKEARETLAAYGTSVEALRAKLRSEGLLPVLQELNERFDGNAEAMAAAFPNARALRGVLGLVGENAEEVEGIFARMADTTGTADEAFGAVEEGMTFQFNRALAAGKALLVEVGDTLNTFFLPVVRTAANVLERATAIWQRMSAAAKGVAAGAGIAAAAIGPLLSAVALGLKLWPAFAAAGSAVAGILSGPVVAGVAAAAAAIMLLVKNWDRVVTYFQSGGGRRLVDAAREVWEQIRGAATTALEALRRIVGGALEEIGRLFDAGLVRWIAGRVVDAFEDLLSIAVPVMRQVGDTVDHLATVFRHAVGFIVDLIRLDFAGAWSHLTKIAQSVGRYFVKTLLNMADAVLGWVQSIADIIPGADKVFDDLRGRIRELYRDIEAGGKRTADAVKDAATEGARATRETADAAADGAEDAAERTAGAFAGAAQKIRRAAAAAAGGDIWAPLRRQMKTQGRIKGQARSGLQGLGGLGDVARRARAQLEPVREILRSVGDMIEGHVRPKAEAVSEAVGGFVDRLFEGEIRVRSLGDAFQAMGNVVSGVLKQMIKQLAQAAATAAVLSMLFPGASGGFAASFSSLLGGGGGLPGRRAGGPVQPGRLYETHGLGEREFFVPERAGTITPASGFRNMPKRQVATVQLGQPVVLPNGDFQFALEEGSRRESRRGAADAAGGATTL